MATKSWTVADGWADRNDAEKHARELRKAHPEYRIRIRRGSPFGGGVWLVEYQEKH